MYRAEHISGAGGYIMQLNNDSRARYPNWQGGALMHLARGDLYFITARSRDSLSSDMFLPCSPGVVLLPMLFCYTVATLKKSTSKPSTAYQNGRNNGTSTRFRANQQEVIDPLLKTCRSECLHSERRLVLQMCSTHTSRRTPCRCWLLAMSNRLLGSEQLSQSGRSEERRKQKLCRGLYESSSGQLHRVVCR